MARVLAIPDMHLPWVNAAALAKVYSIAAESKPDHVIQLGDLYDKFSFSRFARTLDLMTPKQELEEARAGAEAFWKNMRSATSSKTKFTQMLGNHDARVMARIEEKFPEIASLIDLSKLYRFQNVETVDSDRSEYQIDGVIYVHGWLTGLGKHATYFDRCVVHGHSHKGGVIYYPRRGRVIWELDCGFLADETQRPLQYSKTLTTQWTLGVGIVDALGPRFVPIIPK